VFFWKLFWFLRLIYWCKLVLQQDWYDQANLLQNLNRHHYLKDEWQMNVLKYAGFFLI